MNQFRMIALDIDGTLLYSSGEITARVQRAVTEAVHSGVIVTLATGRNWRGALPVAGALGLQGPIVVSNGALVRTCSTGETLDCRPLDRHVAAAAVHLLKKMGFAPLVSRADATGPELFYEQAPCLPGSGPVLGRSPEDVQQVFDLAGLALAADPMKVMALDRTESVAAVADRVRRQFRGQVEVIVTREGQGYSLLEVAPPSITKATGLEQLAQCYGITHDEVIAFGDNFNDLEMLQWAGLGVAMGNAPDAVKAIADSVTATNDEDGVARVLEHVFARVA